MDYAQAPVKPDKQFKRALELNSRHTFKLERTGTGELVVKLKNHQTRDAINTNPLELAAKLGAKE